jgi:transglutaminase-like putative cysteine protease
LENRAKLQRHSTAAPSIIEGKGWLAVDPADVRKVVLEEELAVDSETVRALGERLLGNWEMNWVGFNYARDFTLPGQKDGPIGFLMYPSESPNGARLLTGSGQFRLLHFAQEIV